MILSFIQRYLTAGLAFLALTGFFYGGIQTYRLQGLKLKNAESLAAAQKHAREIEEQWDQDALTNEGVQREELDAINTSHLDAIGRVRDNFKRMPKATCPSSDAASPPAIQLYEQGAVDLVSVAADADKIAADLRACQAWVQSVTK